MRLAARVPIAWLNLTHSKRQFPAVGPRHQLRGRADAGRTRLLRRLLDSQTALVNKVDADLFVVSASMSTVTDAQSFPLSRLDQARAVRGVAWVQPLYVRDYPFVWKNPEKTDILQWPIRVVAFLPDPDHPVFREDQMPGFAANQNLLRSPRTALMDERSKPVYDAIRRWRTGGPSPVGVEREVAGKSLRIVGLFQLGTDFTTDGNLLMSAQFAGLSTGAGTAGSRATRPGETRRRS